MSAIQAVNYRCQQCDSVGEDAHGVEGSFCSRECYHRHRGERFLRNIKFDHRYCFACMRSLKTVAKPTPSAPACVIGYQYLTEHAEIGETVYESDPEIIGTGTICSCGTTNHQDPYLRELDLVGAVERFFEVFIAMHAEGQHDLRLDGYAMLDALKADPSDWAYAVGVALSDADDGGRAKP